jgi:dUTP pyrophosphatase
MRGYANVPAMFEPRISVRVHRLPHGRDIELPASMTAGAAGADVRAALDAAVTLAPGDIVMIPTGLTLEIPAGWEVQIRPRSGLAVKHGITLPNAPATIDSDYRGEIRIALIHLGREPFTVERGMRIAQMLAAPVTRIEWEDCDRLSATARGAGGFGHSGVE